jgi:excisionase family DNA binding protein
MTTRPEERLTYTAEEAAQLMGLSVRGVQDLCAKGDLPGVKLAGKWLIPAWRLCEQLGVPALSPRLDNKHLLSPQRAEKAREVRRLALDLLRAVDAMEEVDASLPTGD